MSAHGTKVAMIDGNPTPQWIAGYLDTLAALYREAKAEGDLVMVAYASRERAKYGRLLRAWQARDERQNRQEGRRETA